MLGTWLVTALPSLVKSAAAAAVWLAALFAAPQVSPPPRPLDLEEDVWRTLTADGRAAVEAAAERYAAFPDIMNLPPGAERPILEELLRGVRSPALRDAVHWKLEIVTRSLGDHQAALGHLRAQLEHVPKTAVSKHARDHLRVQIARTFIRMGRDADALAELRKIKRQPGGANTTNFEVSNAAAVAEVYRRLGKPAEGMLAYLADPPPPADVPLNRQFFNLGTAYLARVAADDPGVARAMQTRFVEKYGKYADADGLGMAAYTFQRAGEPGVAGRLGEVLVKEFPNSRSAAAWRLGEVQEALDQDRLLDAELLMNAIRGNPHVPERFQRRLPDRSRADGALPGPRPVPDPAFAPPGPPARGRGLSENPGQ